MKYPHLTIAQIEYQARILRPYAPPKRYSWRHKFACILDVERLRCMNAVQAFPALAALDLAAIQDKRQALARVESLFSAFSGRYRDFVRALCRDLALSRKCKNIAFIAQEEHLFFRLRHLDALL